MTANPTKARTNSLAVISLLPRQGIRYSVAPRGALPARFSNCEGRPGSGLGAIFQGNVLGCPALSSYNQVQGLGPHRELIGK